MKFPIFIARAASFTAALINPFISWIWILFSLWSRMLREFYNLNPAVRFPSVNTAAKVGGQSAIFLIHASITDPVWTDPAGTAGLWRGGFYYKYQNSCGFLTFFLCFTVSGGLSVFVTDFLRDVSFKLCLRRTCWQEGLVKHVTMNSCWYSYGEMKSAQKDTNFKNIILLLGADTQWFASAANAAVVE